MAKTKKTDELEENLDKLTLLFGKGTVARN